MRRERLMLGSRAAALLGFTFLLVSCGPSHEEREQTREAERLQAIAASKHALETFAKNHNAFPFEIIPPHRRASRKFTAHFQQELEGAVVAFRGRLQDVVRRSSQEYELVLDPIPGDAVIALRTTREHAEKLLASPPEPLASFLVAARIDRVAPVILEAVPCDEADCFEISLESHLSENPLRITGEAIAVELQRRPAPAHR